MPYLFLPQEEDFKRWIREILHEELKAAGIDSPLFPEEGDPPLLNRKEIAGYLRISLVTLHDWMKKGLPYRKKGARVLFLKAEVLEWVKGKNPNRFPD